jgi:hypothetical protein
MADRVLTALVMRRADLTGAIHKAQGELQQMHADLASLDAVIRQIDPEYPLEAIRPRYRRAAQVGEFGSISRVVLDHLRKAARPMTAKEIANRIIAERGLNSGDRALARNMNKRVGMAIRYQRTNGMINEAGMSGQEVVWKIAG